MPLLEQARPQVPIGARRPRPHPLAVLRIGFAGVWMTQLALAGMTIWLLGVAPEAAWAPVGPAHLLGGPPSLGGLALVWSAAVAATVALALGWRTRMASVACLGTSVALLAIVNSLGKLDHGANLCLLFLAVFTFSDWGEVGSMDARRKRRSPAAGASIPERSPVDGRRPLAVFLAVAALTYFSGALVKLTRGEYLASGRLEAFLAAMNASRVPPPVPMQAVLEWLMAHRWATDLLGALALVLELVVAAALLGRPFRILVVGSLVVFHAAIALLSSISFFAGTMLWLVVGLAAVWAGDGPQGRPLGLPKAVSIGAACVAGIVVALGVARWLPGSWGLEAVTQAATTLAMWTVPLRTQEAWMAWGALGLLALAGGAWAVARPIAAAARTPAGDGRQRTFLYDGGCGFCRRWCDWAARRTGTDVVYTPCQEAADLRAKAGIPDGACLHAAFFVERHADGAVGRVERGAGAINATLERFQGAWRAPWRIAALAYRCDGLRQAQEVGYRLVADNRHRLGDDACAINGASAASASLETAVGREGTGG